MNVVVTGGGTIAPIDEVRHIANTSSGRFSASITEACLERGARVTHIHTPGAQLPFERSACFRLADCAEPDRAPGELDRLDSLRRAYLAVRERLRLVPLATGTVHDYATTLEQVLRAGPVDLAFLAMAVSDYEPEPVSGKIESRLDRIEIRCRRTPKVIQSVRDWAPDVYLVGFKLLSGATIEQLIERALEGCRVNRADLTVANDLHTVRATRHVVYLVRPDHDVESLGPSARLAAELVDRVFDFVGQRREGSS